MLEQREKGELKRAKYSEFCRWGLTTDLNITSNVNNNYQLCHLNSKDKTQNVRPFVSAS